MPDGNAIGDFLRARRELLRPKDVGIPEFPDRRRVPGPSSPMFTLRSP
jgi:hypothetical protein